MLAAANLAASKSTLVSTMLVIRDPHELFLLCHGGGDDAVSWVERLDPSSLETIARSSDLAGGKTWPGGLAAHANGSLYVVFGRYAHRLDADLSLVASRELPRDRPYNSFVILSDGSLATKDFGGARPGDNTAWLAQDTEVVILEPESLEIVARATVAEASIARLSAIDDDIYVVGTNALHRLHYTSDPTTLRVDDDFAVPYRRDELGEGYGWDPVLVDGSAWFLNNGQGSERYNGSLEGLGVARCPQVVIRVELATRELTRYEVNAQDGAIVANPPAVDAARSIVVGYDTGNAVVTAWRYGPGAPEKIWSISLHHGSHPIVLSAHGVVVLGDFDPARGIEDLVGVDLETGEERFRVAGASPVQSVLFGAVDADGSIYSCSFLALSKVSFRV